MRWQWVAMVGMLVAAAPACESEDATSCDEGGRTYEDGQNWTCSDGCNLCSCNDGTTASSLMGCPSPPGPAAGKLMCEENDFWHQHGETWVCANGCDECSCSDGELQTVVGACAAGGSG